MPIGRLRRFLTRRTDLKKLKASELPALIRAYYNTLRQCLGYRPPAAVFAAGVLHLQCEPAHI